jgi:hypothetical protein
MGGGGILCNSKLVEHSPKVNLYFVAKRNIFDTLTEALKQIIFGSYFHFFLTLKPNLWPEHLKIKENCFFRKI